MALTCNAASLSASSSDLYQKLTHKQLLAALVYVLCTANGMNCTPKSLSDASNCLYCAMTEKQLIAALLFVQCSGGGGGGGSVACGTGAPTTPPSGTCGFYIQTDSAPNPGVIWEYFNGSWHQG